MFSAKFITHNLETDAPAVYKTVFRAQGQVKRAIVKVTALGVYALVINGKRIGEDYFTPGWTNYVKRLQYQKYDVTAMLQAENTVEITVAGGWYTGVVGFFHQKNIYGDKTAAAFQLDIEYTNGETATVISDENWRVTTGETRFAEIQDGEIIDHTFTVSADCHAQTLDYPLEKLVPQELEPVRVTKRIAAQRLFVTPKGETVIDFEQNMSGVVETRLNCAKGTEVTLKFAEALDRDGNFYIVNLRGAKATDTFICAGSGEEIFRPRFTYHGFRYVQVIGLENVEKERFTACAMHSKMAQTGAFTCSNEKVNRLQSNIEWGLRSNFFEVHTDCPQRDERLGWTGDAQVISNTAAFNFNVLAFYKKWLRDLASEQTAEKGVPPVVPNIFINMPAEVSDALSEVEETVTSGAAVWGDAATIIPWNMYLAYGDVDILCEQYGSMKAWVNYERSRVSADGLWRGDFQYGDWLALDRPDFPELTLDDRKGATDPDYIASVFLAHSADIVSKTAAVLGNNADAKEYAALRDKTTAAVRKEYLDENGVPKRDTQTAHIIALKFGVMEERHRTNVLKALVNNIHAHDDHLTTGFVGTPYLLHVLSDNGMHDLAGKLLLQEDLPSWLYAVNMGATTIWERWDSVSPDGDIPENGMNSLNHYAYGSVGEWLYTKLAGVRIIEPGYKKSRIEPRLVAGITFADASVDTKFGKLSCRYEENGGGFKADVTIPESTVAVVKLPRWEVECEFAEGEYHFE